MIVWLIVPWGWGDFDIFLKAYKNPPNDCMANCSMGPGDFDIFLKAYKILQEPPNDCMANSIWYVEATWSGKHPSNII